MIELSVESLPPDQRRQARSGWLVVTAGRACLHLEMMKAGGGTKPMPSFQQRMSIPGRTDEGVAEQEPGPHLRRGCSQHPDLEVNLSIPERVRTLAQSSVE